MAHYKFKKIPAGIGLVRLHKRESLLPDHIYEYAKSFRNIYTRSAPILRKILDPERASTEEVRQLHGKAQSLAVQLAISNELLLKAILLGSTGKLIKGHNLEEFVNRLDSRYQDMIKGYFKNNGLKDDRWHKVLNTSAEIFVTARYGFEGKDYILDFMTLQLLNESLDDIYNNYLPDWTRLTKSQQKDEKILKQEVDLIFDQDHQKEQSRLLRLWRKIIKD